MNLLNIDAQNKMHVCYLYLSSTPSLRLVAKSLAIKYKSDNPEPLWIKLILMEARLLFGLLKSIMYCSCIAVLPPFIEEKILPTCSKAMGIFYQAVLSSRVWGLFPEIHRICSSRSLHSEAVLFPILWVLPLVKLLPII